MTVNNQASKFAAKFSKWLMILPAFAFPASAASTDNSHCGEVNALVAGSGSNFTNPLELEITSNDTLALTDAQNCNIAQLASGAREFGCYWEFKHKAPNAISKFDNLDARLRNCLDERAIQKDDQPVNHPDFYALKTYEIDGAIFSVSLKDKSALDKTYVFLRVTHKQND